ncbi:MAG TPA: hypothetical protein VMD30_03310, partial [Tepidisphaeraceae bacterium]|nr:hypothetical protein [Tepidisphaeraceae bacterium]
WLYFPAAIAMKCPLATITAIVAALLALAGNHRVFQRAENQWTLAAFAIPPLVYLAVSMHSYLNIGVRHVFPVYPFVFIAVGLGVARLWEHHAARLPLCALAGVLIVETLSAFPNYIAFFNVACRSDEIKLLSDSNLDWGQDLPLLADWQKGHAKTTVYFDYFGSADPAEYGIRSVDIRKPLARPPAEPSVLAVSATYLQLHHFDRAAFKKLGVQRPDSPLAILGGTIYLFTVR